MSSSQILTAVVTVAYLANIGLIIAEREMQ